MSRRASRCTLAALVICGLAALISIRSTAAQATRADVPWPRHVIDDSSRGADGVRLLDVNGDGLEDIATGWEEGGLTRVYLHPGFEKVRQAWPAVTVGRTASVEDAVLVDLDADGAVDVVSCCEGKTRAVLIHWAPKEADRYLDPTAWRTETMPAAKGRTMWMFCLPMQVDGRRGVDLVVGAKGNGAAIGWLESPEAPRDLAAWRWHPITDAGWIMSLSARDMDGDGDPDVLTTDRKGSARACRWLENPLPEGDSSRPWKSHVLGGADQENMFLAVGDLDGDGREDIVCAEKGQKFRFYRATGETARPYEPHVIAMPHGDRVGGGKGVAIADVDLDGRSDLIFTCESAYAPRSGAAWLAFDRFPSGDDWRFHEISGPVGIKYDRIEMRDLDGDGDLDLLTCEEREKTARSAGGLGVIWYENPTR